MFVLCYVVVQQYSFMFVTSVRKSFFAWIGVVPWCSWCWDEWDNTALQTQDSKFDSGRFEVELATFRLRRLPTIFNLCEWAGKKLFFFETWMPERGSKPRSPTFQAGSFNHCTGPTPVLRQMDHSVRKTDNVLCTPNILIVVLSIWLLGIFLILINTLL